MNRATSIAIASLLLASCVGPLPEGPPDDVGAEGAGGLFVGHRPIELEGAAIRARSVTGIRARVDDAAVPFTAARVPSALRLNLFGDAVFDAVPSLVTSHGGTVVWHGEIVGHRDSRVSLAFREGAVTGTVRVDGRLFDIRPRPEGAVIVELDEAGLLEDGPAVVPPPESPAVAGDGAPPASADTVADIDVLVVYTTEARRSAGEAGVRATIDLAVEDANQGFQTSGIPARFHVVGTAEVDYDENDIDYNLALARLVDRSDGHLDEVPALRDELGADHVVMLVNRVGAYAGLGYQMTRENRASFANYAYSVVARDYAAGGYTLAHEIGHNLGAAHDPDHADQDGWDAYSHGHQVPEAGYRTIMAYPCPGHACPRTNVWSSPTRSHDGGIAGVEGISDNVATLSETASVAAGFRSRPRSLVAAQITRPANGSVLGAASVAFEWSDVGADEYLLFVGRAPGDGTFFGGSVGTRTAQSVAGLPSDGGIVYARLFSRFGDELLSSDASFTAARAIEPRARLLFPDRQLPGSWSFFGWHDVEGAIEYRLEVGTLLEPARYHSSVTDDSFAFVAGLPTDGSEVITRLSTRGPAGWRTFAAIHRAWRAPAYAASIESPAPGDELAGGAAVFRWGSATRARAHWLVVQDDDGIIAAVPSDETQVRVGGLPTDGRRLWVALYSLGAEGWVATSAAYRAADR